MTPADRGARLAPPPGMRGAAAHADNDPPSDADLLEGLLRREPAASRRFVVRYHKLIELCVRRVYARSGVRLQGHDLRDAVADVWASLFDHDMRCLRRFEPSRRVRLSTWVALLARNRAVDQLRASHEHLHLPLDDAGAPEQVCARPTPADTVEWSEQLDLARRALQSLRPDEQRFLAAWYVDELSPSAIACQFSVALGTVHSRRFKLQQKLGRAIRRLRWERA